MHGTGKKDEAEELKKKVQENADRLESLSTEEKTLKQRLEDHDDDSGISLILPYQLKKTTTKMLK